jgi:tetratricopeptide (TPR) repeat protein
VGGIEQARGDLDGALLKYEESLAIARRLAEELGTPESLRDVIISLDRVAGIEQARGNLDGALSRYEESLAFQQLLLGARDTRNSVQELNNFIWSTQLCASTELSLSRAEAALVRLEAVVEHVSALESATDTNILDTAAAYWERRVEALDALGWTAEAAESRTRAAALRARIAEIGGG